VVTRLNLKRGDTLDLTVGPVLDETDVVQDLSGSTIRFTAKDRLDDLDADAVLSGSTGDGRVTIPSQAGNLKGFAYVSIPASATAGFTTDRVLHWDVQVSQPSGRTKTLDEGLLFVRRDVTRAT
jgi:hypothetical protein